MKSKHMAAGAFASALTLLPFIETPAKAASVILGDPLINIIVVANNQSDTTGIVSSVYQSLSIQKTNGSGAGEATGQALLFSPIPINQNFNGVFGVANATGVASAGVTIHGSYSFELVGPANYSGTVPVLIQAQGAVTPAVAVDQTNNAFLQISGTTVSGAPFGGHLLGYACLDGPSTGGCNGAWHLPNQSSFAVNSTLDLQPNVELSLQLDLVISAHGFTIGAFDHEYGFIDPIITIDPTFPDANLFSLAFSPGMDTLPTPLPAALPLFATGVGALGLLGWRRKKKAATLVA
jgi:hypothetical protein